MYLTEREQAILDLLADDHTNRQIAHKLDISVIAVADHLAQIYRKLGAHDRESAIAAAMQLTEREVVP